MTPLYDLAVYKNRPALVKERAGDKIQLELPGGQIIKAREKDFEIIHSGAAADLHTLETDAAALAAEKQTAVRDTWELLESDSAAVPLAEIAGLAFGVFNPVSAWAAFLLLIDGLYFDGTPAAVTPRGREAVEAAEKKRLEKHKESEEREQFLARVKSRLKLPPDADARPASDSRFIQDVEALALGKTSKSKTMKDLNLGETPEDAHALLLSAGFWNTFTNPHPARFGLSLAPAKSEIAPPPAETRRDLTRLASFAIDNPWSSDPDDAVSIEMSGGKIILFVHIADPASVIRADSPAEKEARGRGATLYVPESSVWMLGEQAIAVFALGLAETSPALTFKITLGADGAVEDTEIFPSTVRVTRLTYPEADKLLAESPLGETVDTVTRNAAEVLRMLRDLADKNIKRRSAAGAVNIDLPETHIVFADGRVTIEPVLPYVSAEIVRECMLLAGEAAARWASSRQLDTGGFAFPFVCQETGDIPRDILPGFAGSYQTRRCMRPRSLSLKPASHWGLGLEMYTQVTSPLRRYTDLLAHLQIRAFLRGEAPLSADEAQARLGAGEAAAAAAVRAERASRAHWTLVYLRDKKDSVWEAAALEKKGNRWALVIPALAFETQVPLRAEISPNAAVKLALKSVNIPRGEAVFVEA